MQVPLSEGAPSGVLLERGCLLYDEVWAVDFEFQAPDGYRPNPVCMVARELFSGRTIRMWRDELLKAKEPPFRTDKGAAFVAYYASAEIGCFLALGWEPPINVIDFFTEFRAKTNGTQLVAGASLLGALMHHRLSTIGAEAKEEMRYLIMYRASMLWTAAERKQIIEYCESDVVALARLAPRMVEYILRNGDQSLSQALFRGRYMIAAARMEWEGVPIDAQLLHRLNANWDGIRTSLIRSTDADYGIYTDFGTFSMDRFDGFLRKHGLPWPRTPNGMPETKQNTFRDMAATHPLLQPLAELRGTLAELRLNRLAVGPDDHNRTLLSAFRARTGRNQPSNAKFVFGPAKWIRFLIMPPEGSALAYIDWRSQEIAIAAGLSGDQNLIRAYQTDPYLDFAIAAGMAPQGATKATHGKERDVCKAIVLGVNYGMGSDAMAYRAGISRGEARTLLRLHRETYRNFWEWSELQIDRGMSGQTIYTRLGWPLRVGRGDYNGRSLMNHPMQANGADSMRLAACLATEAGHRICAPVHDALLLIGDAATIEDEARAVAAIMEQVGETVARIPVDADIAITKPRERYFEKRGANMFAKVMEHLERAENG